MALKAGWVVFLVTQRFQLFGVADPVCEKNTITIASLVIVIIVSAGILGIIQGI